MRTEARALLWTGRQEFELIRTPLPELEAGQVLVRVHAAAICGSDRHTVEGRRPAPCPSVLGHEGVGEVVALGPPGGADDACARALDGAPVQIGDRLVWSVISACGDCDRCRGGHTAKCRHLRKAGHEPFDGSWPLSGSYASHVLLPAGHHVARVPEDVADGPAAVAACAGATVMAALDAVPAAALAGARVLISGVGMLGLLAITAAREAGAADIHAIDPAAARRDLALQAGADSTSSPEDGPTHVSGAADVAFEFSGVPAGVETALGALDVGGAAVLAGSVFPGPPVALDPEWVVRGRRHVVGVHNYEPQHLAQAVELLASPRGLGLDWESILSPPVELDEGPAAFQLAPTHLRTLLRP